MILAALLVTAACMFHHEAMRVVARAAPRLGHGPRYRVLAIVLPLFAVHLAELTFYAAVFWTAVEAFALGAFGGGTTVISLDEIESDLTLRRFIGPWPSSYSGDVSVNFWRIGKCGTGVLK